MKTEDLHYTARLAVETPAKAPYLPCSAFYRDRCCILRLKQKNALNSHNTP